MKKIVTIGVVTMATIGVVSVGGLSASALGSQGGFSSSVATYRGGGQVGRQASLELRAELFNMSVTDLQKALETKTMSQIAVEHGMDEETFQAKMGEAAKARWEARGLSTEEIAKRIAERDARHEANSANHEFGSGEGGHQGGYGKNR